MSLVVLCSWRLVSHLVRNWSTSPLLLGAPFGCKCRIEQFERVNEQAICDLIGRVCRVNGQLHNEAWTHSSVATEVEDYISIWLFLSSSCFFELIPGAAVDSTADICVCGALPVIPAACVVTQRTSDGQMHRHYNRHLYTEWNERKQNFARTKNAETCFCFIVPSSHYSSLGTTSSVSLH